IFDSLTPGTVQKWIEPGAKQWKARVLNSVKEGTSWQPGKGRIKLLAQHPDVLNTIRKSLTGMRLAKLPVNSHIARHICYGFIQEMAPQLLEQPYNGAITNSFNSTIQRFLSTDLNWSYRAPTNAAQKIPDD
ncbi:hypothetical protein BJ508DRAFT_198378, partial [Ascobolus immersus RN42]